MKFREPRFYKGGVGASAVASDPVPTPAPPVTASSAEVIQAEKDLAQQNLIKKSVKKTIYAGDTGGWQPGTPGQPGQAGPAPATYKSKLG